MIDTDKYKGHMKGPWKIYYDKWNKTGGWWIDSIAKYDVGHGYQICRVYGTAQDKNPTAKLIADAPLLLEKVKHYEQIENGPVDVLGCWNWLANNYPDIAMEYQDGDGDNR